MSEGRQTMDPREKPVKPEVSIKGKDQLVIPDFEIDALARCLLPKLRAYYESPEGQAAFEKWQQQHGT